MRRTAIACGLFAWCLLASMSPAAKSDDGELSFHDNCMKTMISGFEQKGVKADDKVRQMSSNYCDCALNQIKTKFTAAELQRLQQPNPDPALLARIQPITQQCAKENFQQ